MSERIHNFNQRLTGFKGILVEWRPSLELRHTFVCTLKWSIFSKFLKLLLPLLDKIFSIIRFWRTNRFSWQRKIKFRKAYRIYLVKSLLSPTGFQVRAVNSSNHENRVIHCKTSPKFYIILSQFHLLLWSMSNNRRRLLGLFCSCIFADLIKIFIFSYVHSAILRRDVRYF